jgi:hypothetical protein
MSSARAKNQPGNYNAEQMAYKQSAEYMLNREYAFANPSYLAGDGLIQGHLPDTVLSRNPNDIESYLFGIGSNNLVKPQTGPFYAKLNAIDSISIMHKVPLIMPRDLMVERDQRQYPMK